MIKKILPFILAGGISMAYAAPTSSCQGRFVNPVTDICWSCIFPMFIGPIPMVFNVGNQKGGTIIDDDKLIPPAFPFLSSGKMPLGTCTCIDRAIVAPIGLMMSWYEPSRFVDVTRTPFCMVGLGGIDLSAGLSGILPAPGYGDSKHEGETSSSFYQTHWFLDPIMAILGIIDTACNVGTSKSMDLMFMSEVDPTWNDDSLSIIFSPEVVLFSSLPAQLACGIDCVGASLPSVNSDNTFLLPDPLYYHRPTNATNPASTTNPSKYLFWCAGCQGSLYPQNGNNSDNAYPVQSSALSALKLNGLVHRMGIEDMTTGVAGMCNNLLPDMFVNKSEWKYSMGFPIPQTVQPSCCNAFGETDAMWNSGASFPYSGEDFTYVMYHQRDCCFL